MTRPVSSLRNLGPAMDAACANAGIDTAEDLISLGTDAAYALLLAHGTRPHFIGYYVIEMALQGRPWNDCRGPEKEALRQRFDAIVAAQREGKGPQAQLPEGALPRALEAALDEVGVRNRPSAQATD